jgi:hypothetical protein
MGRPQLSDCFRETRGRQATNAGARWATLAISLLRALARQIVERIVPRFAVG